MTHHRYFDGAVAALTDTGQVIALKAIPAWLVHPANAGRCAAVFPLRPTPCRPVGHDGGRMPDPTIRPHTSGA